MRQELADSLLSQAGNLADPPVSWRGTDTYIQSEGINQDLGVYENPDDFYRAHGTNVSGWKQWFFINVIRHQMNRNVVRMRSKLKRPAYALTLNPQGSVQGFGQARIE
ncbi:MAG: hypothetical protein VW475_06280, partial [Curvibacter sp.]